MYSPRIVVKGEVYFVVLKGSFKSLNISSCCINLFNAYSLVESAGGNLLAPSASSVYSKYT